MNLFASFCFILFYFFFITTLFTNKFLNLNCKLESQQAALLMLYLVKVRINNFTIIKADNVLIKIVVNNYSGSWQNRWRMTVLGSLLVQLPASRLRLCGRVGSVTGIIREFCLDFESIILQISSGGLLPNVDFLVLIFLNVDF